MGGHVELVLDGRRRFWGKYEDPLGTTLVVDEGGKGAAGVGGGGGGGDAGWWAGVGSLCV